MLHAYRYPSMPARPPPASASPARLRLGPCRHREVGGVKASYRVAPNQTKCVCKLHATKAMGEWGYTCTSTRNSKQIKTSFHSYIVLRKGFRALQHYNYRYIWSYTATHHEPREVALTNKSGFGICRAWRLADNEPRQIGEAGSVCT